MTDNQKIIRLFLEGWGSLHQCSFRVNISLGTAEVPGISQTPIKMKGQETGAMPHRAADLRCERRRHLPWCRIWWRPREGGGRAKKRLLPPSSIKPTVHTARFSVQRHNGQKPGAEKEDINCIFWRFSKFQSNCAPPSRQAVFIAKKLFVVCCSFFPPSCMLPIFPVGDRGQHDFVISASLANLCVLKWRSAHIKAYFCSDLPVCFIPHSATKSQLWSNSWAGCSKVTWGGYSENHWGVQGSRGEERKCVFCVFCCIFQVLRNLWFFWGGPVFLCVFFPVIFKFWWNNFWLWNIFRFGPNCPRDQ